MASDLSRGGIKRPRPDSLGHAVLPSLKRAKEPSHQTPDTPSPAATSATGDAEAGSSVLPWYQNPTRKGRGRAAHGYQLKDFTIQRDGELRMIETAVFWPFTSPDDLEMAESKWDEMEGVFAYSSSPRYDDEVGGRVIVARLSDEKGFERLWSYELPLDRIYNVAWSYDPLTLRPILAVGGHDKLIYVFDYLQRGIMRNKILRGHGDAIFSIVFHPTMPHIFASASADGTIRVWNLYGEDLDPMQAGPSSQNFPMGDADEGSHCIAVLAGWRFGHDAEAGALAFHPHHAAIASGGLDRQVKIWALPPLPPPSGLKDGYAPKGYRPNVISQPIFSTDDIHKFAIDCIDWLGNDVLLSRAGDETVIWKWLGYDRYFQAEAFDATALRATRPDSENSRSFAIIRAVDTRLKEANIRNFDIEATWYWRYGLHHAFEPSEDEIDFATVDLVTDTILIYPVASKPPRLNILNAHIWEPTPPEDELLDERGRYRREHTPNIYGETETMPTGLGWHESRPIRVLDDDSEEAEEEVETTEALDKPPSHALPPEPDATPTAGTEPESRLIPSTAEGTGQGIDRAIRNPLSMLPTPSTLAVPTPSDQASTPIPGPEVTGGQAIWSLGIRPKDLDNCFKRSKLTVMQKLELKRTDHLLQAVAVSPRGAKWIVGVGLGEAVAIWKLRDKPDA